VDLEIDLADASDRLEELCRLLEPCGTENPGPVFAARGVRLADARVVGKGHLKVTLTHGRHRLDGIGWSY
jgi:single-stranded-DNA-specific exonuclease